MPVPHHPPHTHTHSEALGHVQVELLFDAMGPRFKLNSPLF